MVAATSPREFMVPLEMETSRGVITCAAKFVGAVLIFWVSGGLPSAGNTVTEGAKASLLVLLLPTQGFKPLHIGILT